ncbi:MAG: hypothetical protein VXZ27_03230 [SAR324 cluster bacterium]|nr:hypothetical protein [SAR324 cluster bacterium]
MADLPVLDLKNSRVAVPSFALQTNNNGALNEIKDENGRMSLSLEEVIYGKVDDETVNGGLISTSVDLQLNEQRNLSFAYTQISLGNFGKMTVGGVSSRLDATEEMLLVETAEEFDNGKSHLAVSVGRYTSPDSSATLGMVGGKMILDQEDYLIGGSAQLFTGPSGIGDGGQLRLGGGLQDENTSYEVGLDFFQMPLNSTAETSLGLYVDGEYAVDEHVFGATFERVDGQNMDQQNIGARWLKQHERFNVGLNYRISLVWDDGDDYVLNWLGVNATQKF